jgi:hypothetical protein
MPCEPLKKIKPEDISIKVELFYQYERLRLIFDNDEEHPYMKGFKHCMDILTKRMDIVLNSVPNRSGIPNKKT